MLPELGGAQLGIVALIAVAVAGAVIAIVMPMLGSSGANERVKNITAARGSPDTKRQTSLSKLLEGEEGRKRKIQDSLKESEQRRLKKVTLRVLIARAGLQTSIRTFWILSAVLGLVLAVLPTVFGLPWFTGLFTGIVGLIGLPRWYLNMTAKRRQKQFQAALADSVDVMVRGLKAGLPLSDALRMIAAEVGPPVGPEFMEIVEGQRLGIPIDQGLERMYDRMPLPEVSFLGIVISIQSKTGGNLSEALSNLSRVLRERKKMLGKVRAASQEAKDSAKILGFLSVALIGALFFLSPGYLMPIFTTSTGHVVLAGCVVWMLIGALIMRKMINFDI